MVTKVSFLFFLLLFSLEASACDLSKKIVSLSGPMTMLLEEMNLLKSSKLKAISTFHPIRSETSAEILLGGLFMSKKSLAKFKDTVLFYDQSRELRKILTTSNVEQLHEISGRGKSSIEVSEISINVLKPYLVGCEKLITKVELKLNDLKKKLALGKSAKLIFFLGEISHKYPSYIISKDGFVLDLLKSNKINSYKSDLAFVLWSKKALSKYEDFLKIGVSEQKKLKGLNVKKVSEKKYNLSFPGVLTPGISQVNFLNQFIEQTSFFREKNEN